MSCFSCVEFRVLLLKMLFARMTGSAHTSPFEFNLGQAVIFYITIAGGCRYCPSGANFCGILIGVTSYFGNIWKRNECRRIHSSTLMCNIFKMRRIYQKLTVDSPKGIYNLFKAHFVRKRSDHDLPMGKKGCCLQ